MTPFASWMTVFGFVLIPVAATAMWWLTDLEENE